MVPMKWSMVDVAMVWQSHAAARRFSVSKLCQFCSSRARAVTEVMLVASLVPHVKAFSKLPLRAGYH